MAANLSADDVIHFREFQKSFWHLKHLPYYDELGRVADEQFVDIKSGIVNAILAKDMRIAFVYYTTELNKYMDLYSLRFTKADHIELAQLMFDCVVDKTFPHDIVKLSAQTLVTLLTRDHLLTPSDLTPDWRPLYQLYCEHLFGKGDRLPKDDMLTQMIEGVIAVCRPYFSLEATREILDEVRPWIHPFDDTMLRAQRILAIFLPTKLSKFEHDTYGAKLWFDEAWHWFVADARGLWDQYIVHLMARLANDCCGYINWTPYLDVVFARIMRALDLNARKNGPKEPQLSVPPEQAAQQLQLTACWIVYVLGGKDDGAQSYLTRMLNALESYFHPSNTGVHTERLLAFLGSVCNTFVFRVHQERYCKKGARQISLDMRLTDRQIEMFVESVLPCIEWTVFSKGENHTTSAMLRNLAFLAPGLVLPAILDLVYSAMAHTCEPHRLLQSMNCLVAVMIPLVRDNEIGGKRRPLRGSVQRILERHRIAQEDILEDRLRAEGKMSRKNWQQRYFARHRGSPYNQDSLRSTQSPATALTESTSSSTATTSTATASQTISSKDEGAVDATTSGSTLSSPLPSPTLSRSLTSVPSESFIASDSERTSSISRWRLLSASTAKEGDFGSATISVSPPCSTALTTSASSSTSANSVTTTSTTSTSSSSVSQNSVTTSVSSNSSTTASSSTTTTTSTASSTTSATTENTEDVSVASPMKYQSTMTNIKYTTSMMNVASLNEATRRFLQAPLRAHVITLLEVLVPALDINDINKTTLAFEAIQRLFSLIAIVDCSSATEERTDLTYDEAELCMATQRLPLVVDSFISRIFNLVLAISTATPISSSETLNSLADNELESNFSAEEQLLKKYMTNAYCALLDNCSSEIQDAVANRLYDFVKNNMFDNTLGVSIVTGLIYQTVYNSPDKALPLFVNYVMETLPPLLTPTVREQRQLDTTTLWFISLASSLFIVPGNYLVQYRTQCLELYHQLLSLKCPSAYLMSCTALSNTIANLVNTFVETDRGKQAMLSQPMTDFLPIRHWAKKVAKRDISFSWHIPTNEEIDMAGEFVQNFLVRELDRLSRPQMLKKEEIQKSLVILHSVVNAASEMLPPLDGEPVIVEDFSVPLRPIVQPKIVNELTLSGQNIRMLVLERLHEILAYLLLAREEDTKSLTTICAIYSHLIFSRTITPLMYSQILADYAQMTVAFADPVRGKRATVQDQMQVCVTLAHRQRLIMSQTNRLDFNTSHLMIMKDILLLIESPYENVRAGAVAALASIMSTFPQSMQLVTEEIVNVLQKEKASDDEFKGVLSLIATGNLFFTYDWSITSKLLPALVTAKYPDNPAIGSLLRMVEMVGTMGWKDTAITIQVSAELLEKAKSVAVNTMKRNAIEYNEKFLGASEQTYCEIKEAERNDKIRAIYDDLVAKLVSLGQTPLHWRQMRFCLIFMSHLVRHRFTEDGVRVFVRQLVDDKLETRVIALNALWIWMRANRSKSLKTGLRIPGQLPNRSPGAGWPIRYGLLKDNFLLIYDASQRPRTEDEWDTMTLVNKNWVGFYQWPHEIIIDAASSSQLEANRDKASLKPIERVIVDAFLDEEFMGKFCTLLLSQKSDVKNFDINTCRFLYYLFRNYNSILADVFLTRFESCMQSEKIAERRLAPEIFAAIVRGSKLWTFDKLQTLWKRLETTLIPALDALTPDVLVNWAVACEIIFLRVDLRRHTWFIELLFQCCMKPIMHVAQIEIRFSMISAAGCGGFWRATDIHNRKLLLGRALMYSPFFIVRSQMAQIFLSALVCDVANFTTDAKEVHRRFHHISLPVIIRAFSADLSLLWAEAMAIDGSFKNTIPAPNKEAPEHKPAQNALKSLVMLLNGYYGVSHQALVPSVIHMLPLLVHFENDGDAELIKLCNTCLTKKMCQGFTSEETVDNVILTFEKVFEFARSWRSKVSVIIFMQKLVFANLFVFETPDRRNRIMKQIQTSIVDAQMELRHTAAECLSGFVHCGFVDVTDEFINHYTKAALLKPQKKNFDRRHGGVLGLSAIVQAFPYTVPQFLPKVIMTLCEFATFKRKNVIKDSVMHALREFRRTHQDNWDEHRRCFSAAQLKTLTNSLVSPNYYV